MLPIAILAGGLAKRLHPITETIPKSLIPINGTPFISLQLKLLADSGYKVVVLCLGHKAELITDYLKEVDNYNLEIHFSFDGNAPLGTAGAISNALQKLGSKFAVLYGDSYLPVNYKAIEKAFLESSKPALMAVYRNSDNLDTSNIQFLDNQIVKYSKTEKKPEMHHIDYGIGYYTAELFEKLDLYKPTDLYEVLSNLVEESKIVGFEVFERFYEIGSFQGQIDLERFLRGDIE